LFGFQILSEPGFGAILGMGWIFLSEPEFLELRNDRNFRTISKFHKFFNSKNSGSDNIIQENLIKSQKSPQIPVQKNSQSLT